MSLVQRQQRCDGRKYRAETVEQRVDGGWRNEDAVVQQLSMVAGPVIVAHSVVEKIIPQPSLRNMHSLVNWLCIRTLVP